MGTFLENVGTNLITFYRKPFLDSLQSTRKYWDYSLGFNGFGLREF